MKTTAEIQSLVADFVGKLKCDREPASLYDPIDYVLSDGGKRIRPVLALMAYNLYKDDPESILMPASGIETYHNFTLMHDDLIDKADLRRGRPTVHKVWDDTTAILSGTNMLVLAFQRVTSCADDKIRDVMDCFSQTALEVYEGQQYDISFESRQDVCEAEYLNMIRLKTSVLLACALKVGAILADAPAEDQEALYQFGVNIGLAFQLQDDFLDVYGDEKVFGKAIGGDISNNKKTYMLINALQKAEGRDKVELERWISLEEFDRAEKVAAVTAIYNKLGIDAMAKAKMEEYYAKAEQYFAAVSVSDERKAQLHQFALDMMNRQK